MKIIYMSSGLWLSPEAMDNRESGRRESGRSTQVARHDDDDGYR